MDSFSLITDKLAAHPKEALIALLICAVAWLYKDGRKRDDAHLATVNQIAPLAAKLAAGVEAFERTVNLLLPRAPTAPELRIVHPVPSPTDDKKGGE